MGNADMVPGRGSAVPPSLAPLLRRFRGDESPIIRTGAGWWSLLAHLDERLAQIDPHYEVRYVEEEFAGLYFDAHPSISCSSPEEFLAAVDAGEREAERTCEVCGRSGSMMRQDDWLIKLCKEDAKARGARPIRRHENLDAIEKRPTDREIAFAISAGVAAAEFTAAGREAQREWLKLSRRRHDETLACWPDAGELAKTLGVTELHVDRLRRENGVGAVMHPNGTSRFAPWQVTADARLLPHLAAVLAAAGDYGAMDLGSVMTEADKNLDDLSPVAWLVSGLDPQPVLNLLDDLKWS